MGVELPHESPSPAGAGAGLMKRRLAILVAGVAVLAQPGLAGAGTVTLSGDVLSYGAAPGEANRVTIVATPDAGGLSLRVIDTTAPVTAGAGCAPVNANEATCADPTPATGLDSLLVDAGDMADFVQVSTGWYAESIVNGGDGADELVGGYGRRNLLNGDGDADQLVGYDSPFAPSARSWMEGRGLTSSSPAGLATSSTIRPARTP